MPPTHVCLKKWHTITLLLDQPSRSLFWTLSGSLNHDFSHQTTLWCFQSSHMLSFGYALVGVTLNIPSTISAKKFWNLQKLTLHMAWKPLYHYWTDEMRRWIIIHRDRRYCFSIKAEFFAPSRHRFPKTRTVRTKKVIQTKTAVRASNGNRWEN